ncbi:MAG: hypothetical protein ABFE08_04385 [Armatimonadia bacterium]
MKLLTWRLLLAGVALASLTASWAADEPLRVYAYGAVGAQVYVTPQSAIGVGESSSSEIGLSAFAGKYYRGRVPLEVRVGPGIYLVSVLTSPDYTMRDASLKAGEYVWDGYDYHALVLQRNNRFRYAQCYLIEKQKGLPAEVLAVFTDQMPDARPISYDFGGKSTRYFGTEEQAAEQLSEARVPMTFHEDITNGLLAGAKVLLRNGNDRYAIYAETPERVKVQHGTGAGAWAGHRLSICTGS